jgi:hypothetical protein
MRLLSPRRISFLVTCVLVAAVAPRATAGPDFTFDNQGVSPFTDSSDGLTASFSTPTRGGWLMVAPGYFRSPFSGNALFDNRVASNPNGSNPLTVSFNQGVHGVSLDFATMNFGANASTFTLKAYSGGANGTLVGTATAVGIGENLTAGPNGRLTPNVSMMFFPQGVIGFTSDTSFDTLVLSAGPAVDFAIDNLLVSVPEPGGMALAGVALLGACVSAWKRRGRRN